MYCPNCGRKISAGSQFCPYCGVPIKSNSINSKPQAFRRQSSHNVPRNSVRPKRPVPFSRRHHHKKIIWAVLAIIIIIVAGFGYHQYKQSPMSVNLATTMPGHDWKMRDNIWNGHYENNHFSSHSLSYKNNDGSMRHNHVSYGKNYFEIHDSGAVMRFNLQRIHGKNYYFRFSKIHGTTGSYSASYSGGNTITYNFSNGESFKYIKHGNKLTITSGSRHKTIPNNVDGKFIWNILSHKTFKMIKE